MCGGGEWVHVPLGDGGGLGGSAGGGEAKGLRPGSADR